MDRNGHSRRWALLGVSLKCYSTAFCYSFSLLLPAPTSAPQLFFFFPTPPSTASGTNCDRFHISDIYWAGMFYLQILLHGSSIKKRHVDRNMEFGIYFGSLTWSVNLI